MKIEIKNTSSLDAQIKKALGAKMRRIFTKAGPPLLKKQAEILSQTFANSREFQDLSGRFLGEFGFTPQEVANLNRVLSLLVPGGNTITTTSIKATGNDFLMVLDWVDFEKLKNHEFAQHVLTKLDKEGNEVGVTDIVSWVQWLEEGELFRGFQFFRPGGRNAAFSRSGEGLMRKTTGNFFVIEPTRVFERIAKLEKGTALKKGFGILVQRLK